MGLARDVGVGGNTGAAARHYPAGCRAWRELCAAGHPARAPAVRAVGCPARPAARRQL